MARSSWVISRSVFDQRLVQGCQAAGATLVRHRAHDVRRGRTITLDGIHEARVLVGADGAYSVVRRLLGMLPGIRHRPGRSTAAMGFPTSAPASCLATTTTPTKARLLDRLEVLLPGAADGGAHRRVIVCRWPWPAGGRRKDRCCSRGMPRDWSTP